MADDLPPDVNPPPSREPRPHEFVWAFEKDVKRVVCQLYDHGAEGWAVQLVRDGESLGIRRFAAYVQALAHANAIRLLLVGGGWRLMS